MDQATAQSTPPSQPLPSDVVDVVVVGAGPTGLTLAAELRRRGLAPVIVDKQAAGANTSRAAVVHAHTLEALEPLGVVPTLLERGLHVRQAVLGNRDRTLVPIDFAGLPTRYPFMLDIPQNETEAILLARLEELGGSVRRPCEVTGFTQADDRVRVTVTDGTTGELTLAARWLVGCDGMHSTVRERAGIGYAGGSYKQGFALADAVLDGLPTADRLNVVLSGEGLLLLTPLPGNHMRVIADVGDAPPEPSREDIQRLLDARGPRGGRITVREVAWSSRFHVHHRIAERLVAGRVLLCGDAAHVHSPAGGQGMNTGIQDAVELAAALADTLGGAGPERLDAWQARRHRVATHVIKLTDRMMRMATLRGGVARAMRNAALATLGRLPAVRRRIAFQIAGLDLRDGEVG